MKQTISSLLVFVFLAVAVTISSCDKDEQSSPATLDLSKTAVITGIVETQLTFFNDTAEVTLETVPAGTTILVQVDASQYPINPEAVEYENMIYEVAVNANGVYSIEVPTTNRGVQVTLIPSDFVFNQIPLDFDEESGDPIEGTPERKVYSAAPINVSVVSGQTKIVDIFYDYN